MTVLVLLFLVQVETVLVALFAGLQVLLRHFQDFILLVLVLSLLGNLSLLLGDQVSHLDYLHFILEPDDYQVVRLSLHFVVPDLENAHFSYLLNLIDPLIDDLIIYLDKVVELYFELNTSVLEVDLGA